MKNKYLLDENGQLNDNDPIYNLLEEWLESGDFYKVVTTVHKIPEKLHTNRLRFLSVRALIDDAEYSAAKGELISLSEYCTTPSDKAKLYALLGECFYMEDKELKALHCYRHAIEENPHDILISEWEAECEQCKDLIQAEFDELQCTSKKLQECIKSRVHEIPNDMKMVPYDAESFVLILSFLPSVRSIAGVTEPLGLNKGIYADYSDETECATVRQWLIDAYGIRDMETLESAMQREFLVGRHYEGFLNYKKGNPVMGLENLNENSQRTWEACACFFENIAEWIPEGGLSAWDISEKIGLARQAFACGVIKPQEFSSFFFPLMDEAKSHYSSWEEYFTALLLGGSFFIFFLSDFDINESIEFIDTMLQLVCHSNVLDASWNESDIRGIRLDTLNYERWIKVKGTLDFVEKTIHAYKWHDEEDKGTQFTFRIFSDTESTYILVPSVMDFYDYLNLTYAFKNGTIAFGIHNYMPAWDFVSVVSNAVGINGMQYMSRGAHKLLHNIKETDTSNMTLFFRNGYLSEVAFLDEFYNELQLNTMDTTKYTKGFDELMTAIDLEKIKSLKEVSQGYELTVEIIA